MKRLFDVPKLKKKLSSVNKDDFHFWLADLAESSKAFSSNCQVSQVFKKLI